MSLYLPYWNQRLQTLATSLYNPKYSQKYCEPKEVILDGHQTRIRQYLGWKSIAALGRRFTILFHIRLRGQSKYNTQRISRSDYTKNFHHSRRPHEELRAWFLYTNWPDAFNILSQTFSAALQVAVFHYPLILYKNSFYPPPIGNLHIDPYNIS